MILKPDRKLWTPPRSRSMPRSWFKQRGFFTPMGFMKTPFKIDAADFDGFNDNMRLGAGLTGALDSKTGILSFWVRFDANQVGNFINGETTLGGGTVRFFANWGGSSPIRVVARNTSATNILDITSTASYSSGATWWHFLCSWDLAAAAAHLYTNDASDLTVTTLTNDTIDYTVGDWWIGVFPPTFNRINGCLAEFYFAPGQYLDFSVVANRRRFISAIGKPVGLGTTGASPTGTAPLIYHHLNDGEAVANFAINRGTGGGPWTITGTLDAASTSPSD